MNITIQRFVLFIIFVLLGALFSVFSYFYLSQQEKTAEVILKSIQSDISETAYILSKTINERNNIPSSRPFLDRVSVTNDFVAAVLIQDDNEVILTTNPSYNKVLPSDLSYKKEEDIYMYLLNKEYLETDIRYYVGNKQRSLKLIFMLDKEEIGLYLSKHKVNYMIYFGLLPLTFMFLVWYLIRVFVVKPLESLRQFAYYQNNVPKKLQIKELEVVRYSMVQTFQTLENEKKELYAMARTDHLSGLANRNALNEFLERVIAQSTRDSKEFAFLFLDLDNFKSVNDSLGHNVGDELLKKVASIIDEVLRSTDFVARVGGDEFVIIIQDYNSIMELTNVISRIQKQLSQPWVIQTHPVTVNSSIGITFFPKDGKDIVSLMRNSDIAMYEAKAQGRGRYHFFTEELNDRVQGAIVLDKNMRDALDNNEYELYYQPKVDIKSGDIVGAEALLRWVSPSNGIIAPNVFIPLAEENGFILLLGDWILEEAIRQNSIWREKGFDMRISINISSKQLLKADFLNDVVSLLDKYNLKPKMVDLEITEYVFLAQNSENSKILKELHDLGVTISLDDFGTGYSSLSYLKKFPIDYLKIDKIFMDDYDTDDGSIFVETIVKMGQTLNMTVIAEGVELKEQIEYLNEIGCDQYQGYYFSKPVSKQDFEKLYLK